LPSPLSAGLPKSQVCPYLDNTSTPDGTIPPSQAIIEAIAARDGVDVTDVEPPAYDPLFTVANPEALDKLFTTTAGTASSVVVRLEYEGYEASRSRRQQR